MVLGLDVGGANLKAAHCDGLARTVPFPLWKHPQRLTDALRDLVAQLPGADTWAVTMTGELCDCFTTRSQGVRSILASVGQAAGLRRLRVWTLGGFVDVDAAMERPLPAAAANWLALATFAGTLAPAGPALLIDIGSTTTDIIPLGNGRPIPEGRTDAQRLRSGELLYTGVRRTPLCALLGEPRAAEVFATTLDVYLHLGMSPENSDDTDTADGRPATRRAARQRLARMWCADAEELTPDEIDGLATRAFHRQLGLIGDGIRRACGRLSAPPSTVVLAGSGELLALSALPHTAAAHAGRISLAEKFGAEISQAACAYAVALLARTD